MTIWHNTPTVGRGGLQERRHDRIVLKDGHYVLGNDTTSRLKNISQLSKPAFFIPTGAIDEEVNLVPHLIHIFD